MTRMPVLLMLLSLLTACGHKNEQPAQQPVAKTFKSDNVYSSSLSRNPDIVESLWEEKLEQTPALKTLIDKMSELEERTEDSLLAYARFEQKNREYYRMAEIKISNITDSFLKHHATELLAYSKKDYEQKIAVLAALKQQLAQQQLKAQNEVVFLKIATTIAMLEQYQKENLPRASALSDVNKEYDRLVQQLGDMKKQYD